MGPVHTFNGHAANFYLSTGYGPCSINAKLPLIQAAKVDADYFCSSFYGTTYKSTSYEVGTYTDSGSRGYQMHRNTPRCTSKGEDIESTNCNGVKCKIWSNSANFKGLYNIICSKSQGRVINF